MMVLGDKEDHRDGRACGGWRQCEWAAGPDGIKFSSAGVSRWLRNDLVRVLVRPATGVCSEEVAASFGDVQSSALRELMYFLLINARSSAQGHLRWYARNVCSTPSQRRTTACRTTARPSSPRPRSGRTTRRSRASMGTTSSGAGGRCPRALRSSG